MNRARVALLLRELAAAIEEDGDGIPDAPKSRARRRARARPTPPPLPEPTEVDLAAAADLLRRKGKLIS